MVQIYSTAISFCCIALACACSDQGTDAPAQNTNASEQGTDASEQGTDASEQGTDASAPGTDACACPAKPVGYTLRPLECVCGPESAASCPMTFDEALAAMCQPDGQQITRIEGCGMVALDMSTGFTGSRKTFDVGSGALIGLVEYSDVPTFPCDVHESFGGRSLYVDGELVDEDVVPVCPEADFCMACGAGPYPACADAAL